MSADVLLVEAASASLVREYLSRKGLKCALEKMDEEMPRNEQSISNRQALMKYLNLDKLMKKNKEETKPLKAMLEVMARFFMDRRSQASSEPKTPSEDKYRNDAMSTPSSIDFNPQKNEPSCDPYIMKSKHRPSTASLKAIRAKNNDLVMDDDVEGETMMGSGKSGLMTAGETTEFDVAYTTKTPSNRPVSAKQRPGVIMSNNDLGKPRRHSSQFHKPKPMGMPRLSVSEQQQQQNISSYSGGHDSVSNGKSMHNSDNSDYNSASSALSFLNSSRSSDRIKNSSTEESSPVSFEALLMKGEERANLLQKIGLDRKSDRLQNETYSVEHSSMVSDKSQTPFNHRKSDSSLQSKKKSVDMELGDVDDFDDEIGTLDIQRPSSVLAKPKTIQKIHSIPIDIKTAMINAQWLWDPLRETMHYDPDVSLSFLNSYGLSPKNLKNLVLGSPCQQYNDEWLLQAYSFSDMPDLKYGVVQKKGGPCGVLAAVQACVLQEILFGSERLQPNKWCNPSRQERSKALAQALANIFWRAGSEMRAVVALPSDTIHLMSSSKFKQDDVTEKLSLYTFTNYQELSSFLLQSVSQFENDGCPGVILTMYSTILSRKPHQIKSDFDTPDGKMIAAHEYCTQDLVNLILTGKATSNVFNDTVELGSEDGEDQVILKGVTGRSDIGLLSLFEHYKSCQVGTYYKTPKYPIWVVCSESHFSVLFSTRKDLVNDWKVEKRFDLFYYDGLARQQEEIKLTISNLNRNYKPPTSEDDLVPPLEHCIRTKWSDAEIDWNGYDPIL